MGKFRVTASLRYLSLMIVFMLFASNAAARVYSWPDPRHDVLLGHNEFYVVQKGETYAQIAAKLDVPYDSLNAANPGVGPRKLTLDQIYQPHPGTMLFVPTQVILPPIAHVGIVINVAEKRLYFFQPRRHRVYVFPIGVGRANWETPLGRLHIYEKIRNPVWIVPDSIMKFRLKHGDAIDKIVQSGPDNPLGYFAMRLTNHSYLIHGTNEAEGVGRRSSAGCIRLYNADIEELFKKTSKRTQVHILNMPFKVVKDGRDGEIYASFHQPFSEDKKVRQDPLAVVKKLFRKQSSKSVFLVNRKDIISHLRQMTGIPFSPAGDIMAVTASSVTHVTAENH